MADVARSHLENPVARSARMAAGVALALAAGAISVQVWPISEDLHWLLRLLFVPWIGLALGVSMYRSRQATQAGKRIAAFEQGEALVHWTYSAEDWRRYFEDERLRLKEGALTVLAVGGLLFGLFFLVLLFTDFRARGALVLVAVGAGYGLLVGCLFGIASRQISRRAKQPAVAFIGTDAAYIGGRFESWQEPYRQLEAVELLEGDRESVKLVIATNLGRVGDAAQLAQTLLGQPPWKARSQFELIIPVPSGKEASARELVVRLGKRPALEAKHDHGRPSPDSAEAARRRRRSKKA